MSVLSLTGPVPYALSQNYTPVIVVGGVLRTALLTGFCFVILLLRRDGCTVLFRSPAGMFKIEPCHEKTCLLGLRPGKIQTGLISYRD